MQMFTDLITIFCLNQSCIMFSFISYLICL